MAQKTVGVGFKRAAKAILPDSEESKLVADAGSWGPEYMGVVKDLLDDALQRDQQAHRSGKGTPKLTRFSDTVKVLQSAQKTQIQVPDGEGGVKDFSGQYGPPGNCIGPVAMHLLQNPLARDDAAHESFMSDASAIEAKPYYVTRNLLELNHEMAEGGMLGDYSYLMIHHGNMAQGMIDLPFFAADAVLRNCWSVDSVSRLQDSTRKFGKAYEPLLGFGISDESPELTYVADESPVLLAYYDGEDTARLAFNVGSTCFGAKTIENALDYELPATFGKMLVHKEFGFDQAIPEIAFKNGGTRKNPTTNSAGFILPEADFESLTSKTGLREDAIGNFLQPLIASKLGLAFAQRFLVGRELESTEERRDAYMQAFNTRIAAREEGRSIVDDLSADELRRLLDGTYGRKASEKLRWDVTIQAVYAAILSEHEGQCGNGPLQEQCRDRRETVTNRAAKFMQALSEPYDFGGAVDEFRKIHKGIQLLEKPG
ncbi:MAG: hypothetical protein ABH851_06900 [Methanobacteriota archaeon]